MKLATVWWWWQTLLVHRWWKEVTSNYCCILYRRFESPSRALLSLRLGTDSADRGDGLRLRQELVNMFHIVPGSVGGWMSESLKDRQLFIYTSNIRKDKSVTKWRLLGLLHCSWSIKIKAENFFRSDLKNLTTQGMSHLRRWDIQLHLSSQIASSKCYTLFQICWIRGILSCLVIPPSTYLFTAGVEDFCDFNWSHSDTHHSR
jgi:hypothetical protein